MKLETVLFYLICSCALAASLTQRNWAIGATSSRRGKPKKHKKVGVKPRKKPQLKVKPLRVAELKLDGATIGPVKRRERKKG